MQDMAKGTCAYIRLEQILMHTPLHMVHRWYVDVAQRSGPQLPPMCLPVWQPVPVSTAPQVVAIARGGLERRGHDEASFLNRLEVIAETGLTQVGWDATLPGWVDVPCGQRVQVGESGGAARHWRSLRRRGSHRWVAM